MTLAVLASGELREIDLREAARRTAVQVLRGRGRGGAAAVLRAGVLAALGGAGLAGDVRVAPERAGLCSERRDDDDDSGDEEGLFHLFAWLRESLQRGTCRRLRARFWQNSSMIPGSPLQSDRAVPISGAHRPGRPGTRRT